MVNSKLFVGEWDMDKWGVRRKKARVDLLRAEVVFEFFFVFFLYFLYFLVNFWII